MFFQAMHIFASCTSEMDSIWQCSSSMKDHQECCKKNGVSGECWKICDGSSGKFDDMMEFFVDCLDETPKMRKCFSEHLENNPVEK